MDSEFVDSPKKVDTDSAEIRVERGLKQYKLEQDLKAKTSGRSIIDRRFLIREAIFGDYDLIRGSPPNRLIREHFMTGYPPEKLLAEKLVPNFYTFMDEQEERISKLDPVLQAEQGFRLAVLSYMLGIMGHHETDGNGQTSRLIALSYIRQFCPEQDDHYLPIKYATWEDNEYMTALNPILTSTTVVGIPPDMELRDYELYQSSLSLFRKAKDQLDSEAGSAIDPEAFDYDKRSADLALEYLKELNAQGLDIKVEDTRSSADDLKPYEVQSAAARKLQEKYPSGYFGLMNSALSIGYANIMRTLVVLPEGRIALQQYLESGPTDLIDFEPQKDTFGVAKTIYEKSAKALSTLEKEFTRLLKLETESEHRRKFESEVSKNDAQAPVAA